MKAAIAVLVLLVLSALAWTTRWEVLWAHNDRHLLYIINRWTGEIRVIYDDRSTPVRDVPPRPELPIEGPAPNNR